MGTRCCCWGSRLSSCLECHLWKKKKRLGGFRCGQTAPKPLGMQFTAWLCTCIHDRAVRATKDTKRWEGPAPAWMTDLVLTQPNERFFCPLSLFLLSRTNTLPLFCTHPRSLPLFLAFWLSISLSVHTNALGLHTGLIRSKMTRNDKASERKKKGNK